MSYRTGTALAALAILLGTSQLWAHHGYAALFDITKRVTLTGTLTKTDWRNPHIELSLDVRGDSGQMEAWVIEGAPPRFFQAKGLSKSEFAKAIGQTVTIEALRAKDGSLLGSLLKITLPDGKSVTSAPGA
jgi:uncharacterized protein DUF6152